MITSEEYALVNSKRKPIHFFIYIGNNVGIGKIGKSDIYFHSTESIKTFYEEVEKTKLFIAFCGHKKS